MKFTFMTEEGGFDSHIEKSIRGYSNLLMITVNLSRFLVDDESKVVDIGCSTGRLLKQIYEINKDSAPDTEYVGIEIEEEFYKYLNEKENYNIKFYKGDATNYIFKNCNFVTSIFTLQFIKSKYRKRILKKYLRILIQGCICIF